MEPKRSWRKLLLEPFSCGFQVNLRGDGTALRQNAKRTRGQGRAKAAARHLAEQVHHLEPLAGGFGAARKAAVPVD